MADPSPPITPADFANPEFVPVPMARTRHDGWTPQRQQAFLVALEATGTASEAARMVGMSRKSAYQLRARDGSGRFAAAWDRAIAAGRARMFDALFDRAVNGVTTITLKLGGAIQIDHGPDGRIAASQFKSPRPGEQRFARGNASKGDAR